MPQVQVLEGVPSFGQELGRGLGTGVGQGISANLNQYLQQKKNRNALEGLKSFFEQQNFSPEQINSIIESGMPAELAIHASKAFHDRQLDEQKLELQRQKLRGKTELSPEKQEGLQDVFNRQAQLLKGGRLGIKVSPLHPKANPILNPQSAEERAEFDTLGATFESIFKDLVNTGVLSKPRFEYLLSLIPKSSDRDRTIKGKMKALGRIPELKFLDTSILENEDEKSVKKKPSLESFYK